jgi:hypothetical protein
MNECLDPFVSTHNRWPTDDPQGMDKSRFHWRSLSRILRKVETFGLWKRIRVPLPKKHRNTVGAKAHARCIKLMRDLTDDDLRRLVNAKCSADTSDSEGGGGGVNSDDGGNKNDNDAEDDQDLDLDEDAAAELADLAVAQDEGENGDNTGGVLEDKREVPQWSPYHPIQNVVQEIVDASGKDGVSSMELGHRAVGAFYYRPMDQVLHRITDFPARSQPLMYIDLAVIRETSITHRQTHYHYFSYRWHQELVKRGLANEPWSTASKRKKGSKNLSLTEEVPCKELQLDAFGFPTSDSGRLLKKDGTATLADCHILVTEKENINTNIPSSKWTIATGGYGNGRPRKYEKGKEPYLEGKRRKEQREREIREALEKGEEPPPKTPRLMVRKGKGKRKAEVLEEGEGQKEGQELEQMTPSAPKRPRGRPKGSGKVQKATAGKGRGRGKGKKGKAAEEEAEAEAATPATTEPMETEAEATSSAPIPISEGTPAPEPTKVPATPSTQLSNMVLETPHHILNQLPPIPETPHHILNRSSLPTIPETPSTQLSNMVLETPHHILNQSSPLAPIPETPSAAFQKLMLDTPAPASDSALLATPTPAPAVASTPALATPTAKPASPSAPTPTSRSRPMRAKALKAQTSLRNFFTAASKANYLDEGAEEAGDVDTPLVSSGATSLDVTPADSMNVTPAPDSIVAGEDALDTAGSVSVGDKGGTSKAKTPAKTPAMTPAKDKAKATPKTKSKAEQEKAKQATAKGTPKVAVANTRRTAKKIKSISSSATLGQVDEAARELMGAEDDEIPTTPAEPSTPATPATRSLRKRKAAASPVRELGTPVKRGRGVGKEKEKEGEDIDTTTPAQDTVMGVNRPKDVTDDQELVAQQDAMVIEAEVPDKDTVPEDIQTAAEAMELGDTDAIAENTAEAMDVDDTDPKEPADKTDDKTDDKAPPSSQPDAPFAVDDVVVEPDNLAADHESYGSIGGMLALGRQQIVLDLVSTHHGVFPGGNELRHAFNYEYRKKNPKAGEADRRLIRGVVQALQYKGKINQFSFTIQTARGVMVKKLLVAKEVNIDHPLVIEAIRQMKAADCNLWYPEGTDLPPSVQARVGTSVTWVQAPPSAVEETEFDRMYPSLTQTKRSEKATARAIKNQQKAEDRKMRAELKRMKQLGGTLSTWSGKFTEEQRQEAIRRKSELKTKIEKLRTKFANPAVEESEEEPSGPRTIWWNDFVQRPPPDANAFLRDVEEVNSVELMQGEELFDSSQTKNGKLVMINHFGPAIETKGNNKAMSLDNQISKKFNKDGSQHLSPTKRAAAAALNTPANSAEALMEDPSKPQKKRRKRPAGSKAPTNSRRQKAMEELHKVTGLEAIADEQSELPNRTVWTHRNKYTIPREDEDTLLIAVIIVRTLFGNIDRKINWNLIQKAMPQHDTIVFQRRWPRVREMHKTHLKRLQTEFEEMYLQAYAEGSLPRLDMDRPMDFDIRWHIKWFRDNLELPA